MSYPAMQATQVLVGLTLTVLAFLAGIGVGRLRWGGGPPGSRGAALHGWLGGRTSADSAAVDSEPPTRSAHRYLFTTDSTVEGDLLEGDLLEGDLLDEELLDELGSILPPMLMLEPAGRTGHTAAKRTGGASS